MDHPDHSSASGGANPDQLTGWKEIASYLGKAVRTVQRWERHAGLPVHRVQQVGEVVFAFRSEIDRWRNTPRGAQVLAIPADAPSSSSGEVDRLPVDAPAPPAAAPPVDRIAPEKHPDRDPSPGRVPRKHLLMIAACALIVVLALAAFRAGFGEDDFVVIAEPASAQVQGQTFRLTVQGFRPTSPVMRWTRVPNGREEPMLPALQPDQNGEMKWAFSTDCRTETGTHHVWMQDERTGQVSQGVTLVVLANPECDKPLPDLAARVSAVDKASVRAGEQITVTFTIWNVGTAAAVPTQTRARVSIHSTRTAVTDASLGDIPTMALAVGASTTQSATLTIPAETTPGVYYLWVIADNSGATTEPESFNNFARSHAFVITAR